MAGETVGIVGFGRFGQFWSGALKGQLDVLVTDRTRELAAKAEASGLRFVSLDELCALADTVFLCVPINQLETVAASIRSLVRPGMAVVDTCSVKAYPAAVLKRHLGDVEGLELIATHPMFGPDSGANGLAGLPMVMWPLNATTAHYNSWKTTFQALGLRIVEMSPDEHDEWAAYSQGVTHYVGRVLNEMELKTTPIDTRGFRILLSVIEQTCNDTWELFHDLQHYNPHTRTMRTELGKALDRVYGMLLPERLSPDEYVIGIQGGRGSFNEEACRHYCALHADEVPKYRIEYLFTAANVLSALNQGVVDRGVFAVQNAKGGAVMETIHALSHYRCEITDTFEIVVSHCILHHPEVRFQDIDTLVSHPQALAQCASTLAERYPGLGQVRGNEYGEERIDQALCAQHIAEGKLPRTTAVLASRVCADLYGLKIHDTDLQDLGQDNRTTFAWAQRRRFR